MDKNKIIRIASIILFIFILYKLSQFVRLPFQSVKVVEAIPSDLPAFFELSNDHIQTTQWDDFIESKTWGKWSVLQKIPVDLEDLKTLFGTAFSRLKKGKLAVGISKGRADEIELLYVLDGLKKKAFLQAIPESVELQEHTFLNQKLFEAQLEDGSKLSFAFYKNLLLFGRYSVLVEDGLNQIKKRRKNLCQQKNFRRVYHKKYSSDKLHLYLNPSQIYSFIRSSIKRNRQTKLAELSQKQDWISFEITTNKEESFWKGIFTQKIDNQLIRELSKFGKRKDEFDLTLQFPKNTSAFQLLQLNDYKASDSAKKTFFDTYFKEWIGNEYALLLAEPLSDKIEDEQFLIVECKDLDLANELLVENINSDFTLKPAKDYNGFAIAQFQADWDFYEKLEFAPQNLLQPYVVFFENSLVFCNKIGSLEKYIDQQLVNQNLSKEEGFLELYSKVQNEGDSYTYFNPQKSIHLLQSWLAENANSDLLELCKIIQSLNPILLQLTLQSDGFESKILSQKNSDTNPNTNILWRTELNTRAVLEPQILPYKNEYAILTQDEKHTLYLLDKNGKIIWKRQIPLAIQSKVYPIDYYGNGDAFYLFNTAKKIYIINSLGENVNPYPIELQYDMTNGLIAIDFDSSGKYSFFVACSNGSIYGFNQKGNPLLGWNPKQIFGRVEKDFQHFQHNNKDYIVSLNTKAQLQVFQRTGKARFPTINLDSASSFFFENSKASTRIVAKESNGKVRVVNPQGESFKLPICATQKDDTVFCFADLVGDNRKDYFVLDSTRICGKYYEGKQLKESFQYTFNSPQDTLFALTLNTAKKQVLGTINLAKKQINLINQKGELLPYFPLAGTTPFRIVDLYGEEGNVLLVGYENSIYAYGLVLD